MHKRILFRSPWLPYALLAPQLAVTLLFFFWPAARALYQSLRIEDAFGLASQFAGLENFRQLFHDPLYLASFGTTLLFATLVTLGGLAAALLLATMADRVLRARQLYRTLLILPYAIAPAVAGVLWAFLFAPGLGVVAIWLRHIGIDWNHKLDATQAMGLVVFAAVWKQISYNFLFFLAGLQSIPKSLVEAAALDGAGPWRRFRDVIFPLLSPTTFFLLVVNMVYAFFDTFAVIDAITQGGPGQATKVLVYKAFYDGFKGGDAGSSAAQSVVLMAIVVLLTFLQFRFVERKVQY